MLDMNVLYLFLTICVAGFFPVLYVVHKIETALLARRARIEAELQNASAPVTSGYAEAATGVRTPRSTTSSTGQLKGFSGQIGEALMPVCRWAFDWLRRSARFGGRASRLEFLVTQLAVGFAVGFVSAPVVGRILDDEEPAGVFIWAIWLLVLAIAALIGWATATRRTRDTGVNPWWTLILLIPAVNLAALAFLALVPTDEFAGKGL